MRLGRWAGVILSSTVFAPAFGADFDGSKNLICAPVEAMDCVAGEACTRGLPDEIGAPAFIRVDVTKKVISGPMQTTPILFVDKTETRVLLQGKELGFGWTIALEQSTGKLTATLVDEEGVFVLFGNCTPL
jgi:hypothetical protein